MCHGAWNFPGNRSAYECFGQGACSYQKLAVCHLLPLAGRAKSLNCFNVGLGTPVAQSRASTCRSDTMKKTTLLTLTLILGWLSAAQAQVSIDPYPRQDEIQIQGQYPSTPDNNTYNNYLYPRNTNPYTGKATGDPNRYLEHYNQGNSGSGANGSGPVYNPFTIYRK